MGFFGLRLGLQCDAVVEEGAGSFESLAEICGSDFQLVGGFFTGLVFEIERANCLFEIGGEFADAGFDNFEDLGSNFARRLPGRDVDLEFGEIEIGDGVALLLAEPVFGFVPHDASHPGSEIAIGFESFKRAPRADE